MAAGSSTAASTADAVVIGSGAFGASTAYHLAKRGFKVALVDQHALGSQTSPRAAGLTSKADTMPTMARLRHEACEAFERFETEMGRTVDFHRSGSLRAAYTDAAVERVRIAQETARICGIEARVDRRRGGGAAGAPLQAGRGALDPARAERRLGGPGEGRDRLRHPRGRAGRAPAPLHARAGPAERGRPRHRRHDPARGDPRAGGGGRGRRLGRARGRGRRHPAPAGSRAPSALHHRADRRRGAAPAHRAAGRGQRVRALRAGRPALRRLRGRPARARARGPAAGLPDRRARAGPGRAARAGERGGRRTSRPCATPRSRCTGAARPP